MGYPMAGHLSKNKELELFVYNRTKSITTKWLNHHKGFAFQFDELFKIKFDGLIVCLKDDASIINVLVNQKLIRYLKHCLLYTSPSPRDRQKSRMPSSA